MNTLRFFFPLMRPYWKRYLSGILLAPLSTLFALAIPPLTGEAVNELRKISGESAASLEPIIRLSGWILAAALVRGVLIFSVRMLIIGASRDFEFDLRNRLFAHLQSLDCRYFQRMRTGDVMSRLTSDVEAARTLAGPVVMYSVNAFFTLALALPLMAAVDPLLTLLVMVPLSLLTLAVRRIGPKVHAASRRAQEAFAAVGSFAQENFGGVRVVKSFAREDAEIASFRDLSLGLQARNLDAERLSVWMGPVVGSIGEVAVILLLLVGGWMILRGGFTLGQFVQFEGYQTLLIWPMISIGWVINQAYRGTASTQRLDEILAAKSTVGDPPAAAEPRSSVPEKSAEFASSSGPPSIRISSLNFGYGDRAVLSDVSLEAAPGSLVAVVGRTGSGKSTLLSLLPRLWRVPDGAISIDGVDINRIPLERLRSLIGFVPQESFLFSRTIRENLALARDGDAVAPAEVEARARRCAAIARLDKDVDQFPRGYEEIVGERGVTLSGGQKQRVAIARALLADPRILILDDPLSAVDAQTEQEILANLREAARGRTTLVATHRVGGIRLADRIYVLEEGRVVEQGTHAELLRTGRVYPALYQRQVLEDELEGM